MNYSKLNIQLPVSFSLPIKPSTILYPVIAIVLVSCTSGKVSSNYNKKQNFSQYKSYALLPPYDSVDYGFINDSAITLRIEDFIRDEFNIRGYKHNLIQPDLLIRHSTFLVEKTKKQLVSISTDPNLTFDNDFEKKIITYTEGAIMIEIIDRSKDKVIWTGKSMGHKTDQNSFVYEMPWKMKKVFRKYPVRIKVNVLWRKISIPDL